MGDPITNEELAEAIGKIHQKAMDESEPMEGFDPATGTLVLEVPGKGWVRLTGVHIKAIEHGRMDESVATEIPVVFDKTVLAEDVGPEEMRRWWREIEGGLR